MTPPTFHERAASVGALLAKRPLIRVINYHNTPRARVAEFERQLEHCQRHFSPVTEDDLDRYLNSGQWHKSKPGMIVALYEGYRNHYDVFLPLLERHGFIGWFFVITDFVKSPVAEQESFAARHDITTIRDEYADGRYALSWNELRELDRQHIIASHARTHTALASLDPAARASEVVGAQRDFERHLGHPVRSFVSYAGPAHGESVVTDALVVMAEYQFVFSNYQIQRLGSWRRG